MERNDDPLSVASGRSGVARIAPTIARQVDAGGRGRPATSGETVPSSSANPHSIWQLPRMPAVYVLYGGGLGERDVAYVGEADVLVRRVVEQLVVRDPLLLAESPVVALLPFYVAEIRWWTHPSFVEAAALQAAELVATDLLDPPLRGRSRASARAFALYEDADFRTRMTALLSSEPAGALRLPTHAHALEWLAHLELRMKALERLAEAALQAPAGIPRG